MRLSARLTLAAVASSAVLAGCGSASEPSPPSGVDELVIPSPSLDPGDFVDAVDNPWFPLAVGSTWEYDATGGGAARTITVTVVDETREIQGVSATTVVLITVDAQGRTVGEVRAWYAQDVAGNVWFLGKDGAWEAGVGGAEAALAMPAHPRVGDGYWTEYDEGVVEGRAEVVSLDGSASLPYGDLTDLVETDNSSPLDPGIVERRSYARGIGLVQEVAGDEGDELVQLVAFVKG